MARVVGQDPPTDVAVLKVDATNLPAATLTDSANVRVGDVVLAIGNPFGVGQTVTAGIVSAKGRAGFGITDYEDFIQTDASINPGNSGGALVDVTVLRDGNRQRVTATLGELPDEQALAARPGGEPLQPDGLGLRLQNLTPELRQRLELPDQVQGALIADVEPGSPAERAGLRSGDVIVEVNRQGTSNLRNAQSMLRRGEGSVLLRVWSQGGTRYVVVNRE